jgi:predicted metal-binding transcription factor (methanogenesis marker protein 9)
MKRIMVQVTEEQYRTLKEMSAEYKVSISELVRDGVDAVARHASQISHEERKRRIMALSGKYRDVQGAADVSQNHDRYLNEGNESW